MESLLRLLTVLLRTAPQILTVLLFPNQCVLPLLTQSGLISPRVVAIVDLGEQGKIA